MKALIGELVTTICAAEIKKENTGEEVTTAQALTVESIRTMILVRVSSIVLYLILTRET